MGANTPVSGARRVWMRRIVTILAGAALALALVGPAVAGATEKSSSASTTFTAQHYRGGHGHDGGHHDGRYRRGGRCYGCDGPGSRCDRYGCGYAYPYYYYGYPYYYGGYYGGYGCNFDYPCGPPYSDRTYDCSRYRGPDGQAAQNPQCQWNDKCQCYYHGSTPPPGSEKQGPRPAAAPSRRPTGGRGGQPGPDQGQQPAPNQGGESRPY